MSPCEHCPWRTSNHGKRTPWGFYRAGNLRRLWNGIRRGGPQSCHPTDPSHPDHIAAGAKAGATARECPGAVILVLREVEKIASYSPDRLTVSPESMKEYQRNHKDGLTRTGVLYWVVGRYIYGGKPFLGTGPKLPEVDLAQEGIGRLA